MSGFENQVVLVAGGTGALGQAITLAFLDAGATVFVTYRNAKNYDILVTAAAGLKGRLKGESIDVTNETAVNGFVADIVSQYGRLDVLVNAVGGFVGGKKLWEEAAADELEKMLALNLRSGYVLVRSVVPVMLKQDRGAIVNVASKAAETRPGRLGTYVASKAAAIALMDSLADDLKGTGVRVNSLLPETIDTEVNRNAMRSADYSKWSKPSDIARVVLFLCSDEASLVSGATLVV